MAGRGCWFAVRAAMIAACVAAAHAEDRTAGRLIAEVLPPFRIGAAVCFEGTADGKAPDGGDRLQARRVQADAEAADRETSPETQAGDQPVRRVQVRLEQLKREIAADDRLYALKVLVEPTGARGALVASGDCSLRSRRHVMDGNGTLEATTTAMHCNIDCGGGGIDLVRVAGSGEIDLDFGRTGIRMSGGCTGGGFVVGRLESEPATGGPPAKPPMFRLHRAAGRSCAELANWRD